MSGIGPWVNKYVIPLDFPKLLDLLTPKRKQPY